MIALSDYRLSSGWLVFALASVSLVALWFSFPPVGIWWVAWLAPMPLIYLVLLPTLSQAPGSSSSDANSSGANSSGAYWKLYLAGVVYWLATFYFIPIPHPALWGGWIAVSVYMAIYTPLFVGVTRVLVHGCNVPVLVAAPIVWTGLEYFRCHFATGMPMVCLSHSQYQVPILIQVADLSGAYTLTFLMVGFATGMSQIVFELRQPQRQPVTRRWVTYVVPIVSSLLIVAFTLAYGGFKLGELEQTSIASSKLQGPRLRVALIQTSFDVRFQRLSRKDQEARVDQTIALTQRALREEPLLDLVVWPEGAFFPMDDYLSNGGMSVEVSQEITRWFVLNATQRERRRSKVALLGGTLTRDPANDARYNAAIFVNSDGRILQRYYKQHLVMFGEYVPFADQVSMIGQLSPMEKNMTAGDKFEMVEHQGIRLAPSICFETTVPHQIRKQIDTLENEVGPVDAMVNLTNDGWFYGTSCLDLHLACNVFRAVEMRRQHLVCANTGLSAHIDAGGRLLQQTMRRLPEVIIAKIEPGNEETSIYRRIGDTIPFLFSVISVGCFLLSVLTYWFGKTATEAESSK